MNKLALLVLLGAALPAYAQCPAGMDARSCQQWDAFTTPQQRRMDQGLPPNPPPSESRQRYLDGMNELQDTLNRNRQNNVAPQWFQDYQNERRR